MKFIEVDEDKVNEGTKKPPTQCQKKSIARKRISKKIQKKKCSKEIQMKIHIMVFSGKRFGFQTCCRGKRKNIPQFKEKDTLKTDLFREKT